MTIRSIYTQNEFDVIKESELISRRFLDRCTGTEVKNFEIYVGKYVTLTRIERLNYKTKKKTKILPLVILKNNSAEEKSSYRVKVIQFAQERNSYLRRFDTSTAFCS